MISSISGLLSLNNLDMTSCANDVIVVRHSNGSLFSTPFNVRFGKVKVLRPSEKVVRVEVNGLPTSAVMKIGPDGEAFWLKPTLLSEREGGRPESPVSCTNCQNNNTNNNNSNNSNNIANSVSMFKNIDNNPLLTTPKSSELISSPHVQRVKMSERVTEPLIEEDIDGHLKVNAEARQSAADFTEVHLAEETVVAAERAMRRIVRLRIEGDDYLRETAMREKEEGVLSPHLVSLQDCPDAFQSVFGNINSFPNTNTTASFSTTYTKNISSTLCPVTGVHMDTTVKDEKGSATISTEGERHKEKEIGDEMHITEVKISERDGTAPERKSPVNDVASLVPSDEGFDRSDDDYLFENVNEIYEDNVDCRLCVADELSSNVSSAQATCNVPMGNLPDSFLQCDTQLSNINTTTTMPSDDKSEMMYFARTLIPTEADLHKLNLVEGYNHIRYITRTSLRGEVAVEANIYLWDSNDRLVVSDVDGTITKSDLWGHLMPLFGRDWTHPGICSLYSKIHQNGYKFVYLTARSVSQVGMTRNFLWNIQQDGFRLPKGPVLTAPQRFFTALTQEVSKKSHVFKIACLKSVMDTFPKNKKPFYAGFGNRFNDLLSYTATCIPQHKIFIIDPNSVLHVYNVKQTYKNLVDLVDMTFPPIVKRNKRNICGDMSEGYNSYGIFNDNDIISNSSFGIQPSVSQGVISPDGSGSRSPNSVDDDRLHMTFSSTYDTTTTTITSPFRKNIFTKYPITTCTELQDSHNDLAVDQEFDSFLYWRVKPADLVSEKKTKTPINFINKETQEKKHRIKTYLAFSLGSYNNNNNGEDDDNDGLKGKSDDKIISDIETCETNSVHSATPLLSEGCDVPVSYES